MGTVQDSQSDLHQLELAYRQSLERHAEQPELWHRLGLLVYRDGRPDEAIDLLHRAIRANPSAAQYHHDLGNLYFSQGQLTLAVTSFRSAIAIEPGFAQAYLNLGDALAEQRDFNGAAIAYEGALGGKSPFPEAHHNFAAMLLMVGQLNAAIAHCRAAIAQRPQYALAYNTLGTALAKTGEHAAAAEAFREAIKLRPDYAKAYQNLGTVLDQAGRVEEAKAAYHEALRLNPEFAEARYDLAALGAGPPPSSTPSSYLVHLFDSYAATFDEHLVETLNYHVPELLFEAAVACGVGKGLEVLDLGCGTGLVGQRFRALAGRLIGVDVSAGMIEQATRRGVYDKLVLDDAVHYLQSRARGSCDLVLAGDVFIYIGDLADTFQATAQALSPGGRFVFSIESTDEDDYVLRPTRRYAQSMPYINRLAVETGLSLISATPVTLRVHNGADVSGRIVVLQRQA